MTRYRRAGCALMAASALLVLGLVLGSVRLATAGEIGTVLVGGTASHVGTAYGREYLALPEGRGILVRVCGAADCVVRRSTDAGPDRAMQRAGRVVDLNGWDFERVCGCPASAGLTRVTVEYLAEIPLPETDTEGEANR